MTDYKRNFRDYATRVSFNLSLSRNQVGHLAGIVFENELEEFRGKINTDAFYQRADATRNIVAETGGNPANFIVGRKALLNMGLVEFNPKWVAENKRVDKLKEKGIQYINRKYWGTVYVLTPAGDLVVELLRLAGLIPAKAANDQITQDQAKAV